jgi:hypothetical protein
MAQHNLKRHATILEREEFMHLMLVDVVVVVLGEDTVAEAVVWLRWRSPRSWWKPKSKSKLSDYQWCQHFGPQPQFQPQGMESTWTPSGILLEVGDVKTLDDMLASSKRMITKTIPVKMPNNNVMMTSVTEMAIAVVEMDVDSVAVHMADANDYSDIPFHVCHLYF